MSLISSIEFLLAQQADPSIQTPHWVDPVVEEIFGQLDEGSKHEFGDLDKV